MGENSERTTRKMGRKFGLRGGTDETFDQAEAEREAEEKLQAGDYAKAARLYEQLLYACPQEMRFAVQYLEALTEKWNPKRHLSQKQRLLAERLLGRMLRDCTPDARPIAAAAATKWSLLTALWDRRENIQ